MKIFLIGLPGSGKSTLGKSLAELLDLPFVDLDQAIEYHCAKPVHEIFEKEGEDKFREVEAELLRKLSSSKVNFVMATGGGAPCFFEGIGFMNQIGITVLLDVPIEIIVARLDSFATSNRPLLAGKKLNAYESLKQLYQNRKAFYHQAKLIVAGDNIQAIDLQEKILQRLH
ncbi:MAG: shikimate kinase [Cyclobacteriaceae bacterium]|nr:shikimate kinase [Cyclobacteriaceae bacterium]